MNLISKIYSLNKTILFLGIILTNFIIIWLSQNLLINETIFYNTYSEQLTFSRSLQLFENSKEYSWISYILFPVMFLLKLTLISIVVYTGVFLNNLHDKISLGRIYKIVLVSEIIIVFASLTKFLWLYIFGGNYDLNDIGFFYPLSLINFFKIDEVARAWIYPLQVINVFQILYIFSLSYGLKTTCHIPESESEKIVLTSYFPALAMWIILIIFISFDTAV